MRFAKDNDTVVHSDVCSWDASFEIVPNSYHPFSYFVLGGIDISGESTALTGNCESDSSGDLTSATGAGFGYDPRLSGFDIAEAAGTASYEEVRKMAQTASKGGEPSGEPSGEPESTE